MMRIFLGIAGVATVIYAIYQPASGDVPMRRPPDPIPGPIAQPLTIAKMSWRKGGFDSVAFASLSLKNTNAFAVENPEVTCGFYGQSGTLITSNAVTIYQSFPAKQTKRVGELSFGFIDQQVASASCSVD